jgi:hypothetical protein
MIRNMTCCVCGSAAGRWAQHWNRDTGFGICSKCVEWQRDRGTSQEEMKSLYGEPGVNYSDPINPLAALPELSEFKGVSA